MNSTIIRKPCKCGCGRMPSLGYGGYNEMCNPKKRQEKIDKINERQRAILGHKEDDLQTLIDDIDTVYSKWLRILNADENGFVQCYTCSATPVPYTQIECGHYIPRGNLATRWLPQNTKTQCKSCNQYKDGNLKVFKERLEAETPGITEYLYEQSNIVTKPSRWELKELLATYRAKLKIVEQKLKK